MSSHIGIIAGSGDLPSKLIEACKRDNKNVFVVALKGQADKSLVKSIPHQWIKLGETQKAITALKDNNVVDVVFAGSVRRPSITEIKPDTRTLKMFKKLGFSALGDDRLLKSIAEELETDGLKIIGAHEIEPDILSPSGMMTEKEVSKEDAEDIKYGIKVIKQLGELDVGQGAIVQRGIVLGVEAIEGTDNLIKRCSKIRRKGDGGVLVKGVKPQQDKRFDLPTIGTRTIRNAHKAGLVGVAVEAGASIILKREATIRLAHKLGMFIFGFESEK